VLQHSVLAVVRPCFRQEKSLPLNDLPRRVHELDPSKEMVVHCRSGVRSAKAVGFLQHAGFTKTKNLAGGILAWADRIDPKVPKY